MAELNAREQQLMDPKLISAVSKLELKSRQVVEGIMAGMHKSPYKGFSVEFVEHRQYVPGDELRYLDWKVYAKTDRYVIKEFEEETELKVHFVLDTSNSMAYSSSENVPTKMETAILTTASLSHLIIQQGDSAGVSVFNKGIEKFIPSKGGPRQFRRVIEELASVKPGKDTSIGSAFHELAEKVRKRGLIIIVSDLFDKLDDIIVGLAHFKHRKHDIIIFHILDKYELTLPFEDMILFKGLEKSPDLLTEPWQIREEYLKEVETFINGLKKSCQEKLIDYVQILNSEPLELALARYLTTRKIR